MKKEIAKQIKDALIELAIKDKLPLDLTQLDVEIFEKILAPKNLKAIMKKKSSSAYITLSIIKNKKNEFQILQDGSMLKWFEADLLDTQMILRYSINLGYQINKTENRPVKVIDNFSITTPCCSDCGGLDVSTKAWQNFKSGSLETISSEGEDNYCNTCEAHVELDEKKINPKNGIEIASIG